ncbi:hypothetical protein [Streptomyces sp. NPDC101249]|uniref:hypothetical protein n=1 Tax=Streptomyces sp. NPDC101249 TaxID=3366140 RepID=UPI0037FC83AC
MFETGVPRTRQVKLTVVVQYTRTSTDGHHDAGTGRKMGVITSYRHNPAGKQVSGTGKDVNSTEPGTQEAATARLREVVRSFTTTHVAWKPLLIGAVITGGDRMRLYFRSPEKDRTYGADVRTRHTGPGLLAALASSAFLADEHLYRPSDDPHCGVLVDLTGH